MRVRAANGITIDTFRPHTLALAALARIIDAQDHRTGGRKPSDQQTEEEATGLKTTPASAVQHPKVMDKTVLTAQPDQAPTLVTVRWPGARMAPAHSPGVYRPTREGNKGRKLLKRGRETREARTARKTISLE